LGTQKIAGKFFNGVEFLEVCCRSFVNYGIVEFVRLQDDITLRMKYLCYLKDSLVTECFRFPDQPARQTGEKHILSDTNACRKGSNGVSYTSNWRSMAIHARFMNFHVVEYAPDVEPHPLQVSDNKLDMTKGHVDRIELIQYLVDPLDGWFENGRMSLSWNRLLILCYAIGEKKDGGPEFSVYLLTKFP